MRSGISQAKFSPERSPQTGRPSGELKDWCNPMMDMGKIRRPFLVQEPGCEFGEFKANPCNWLSPRCLAKLWASIAGTCRGPQRLLAHSWEKPILRLSLRSPSSTQSFLLQQDSQTFRIQPKSTRCRLSGLSVKFRIPTH